jgi:Carboxypeptidase regulatory-like domain
MRQRKVSGIGLILIFGFVATRAFAGVDALDPRKGEIDGKAALALWARSDTAEQALLDPHGMTVHFVPVAEPDQEFVFPCGEWFSPPAGEYRFWLEGNGQISPAQGVMGYAAAPFRGRGSVAMSEVVRAGTVALDQAVRLESDQDLRLLYVGVQNRSGAPQPEMSRRVLARNESGVLMPAGPLLAGLYDEKANEYRWLTRPLGVPAGGEVLVGPPKKRSGTDVFAILDRPKPAVSFQEYDARAVLIGADGKALQADLLMPTAERLFAVWYGVEERVATLEIRSPSVFLPHREIALRPGKVETYRGKLRPLPQLSVQVDLPAELASREDGLITVSTFPERQKVAERPLARGGGRFLFEKLPVQQLEVVVDLPPWRFTERPDLSDGFDHQVEIYARGVRVSGTVYRGPKPHSAMVSFRFWTGGDKYTLRVDTDSEGNYQAQFFRPTSVALVELDGAPGPPFIQMLSDSFEHDTALDFHLPGNSFSVRTVDAETGAAVTGAEVKYINYRGAPGEDLRKVVGRRVTDSKGRAALPPLTPGEVWLTASADGYREPEYLKVPIDEDESGREIEVALEPEDSHGGRLSLLLPNGAPAGAAEVVATEGSNGQGFWRGSAGPDGLVDLPARIQGSLLLAKSSLSGALARVWSGGDEEWTLPPAAPPLEVSVKRSWGDPAPWARIAVAIDGQVFTGALLQWLAGSSGTDGRGLWLGSGLPQAPLRVVAWVPADDTPRDPVALVSSFGVTAVPPWPGIVELEAVE